MKSNKSSSVTSSVYFVKNGVIPTSEFIRCQVTDVNGKMINVGAIGFDIDTYTDKTDIYPSLWLPKASLTVIKEL